MTNTRIDWRKHDRNAPESTYVRLAKVGDILKFPNDSRLYQVESVDTRPVRYAYDNVKVKFYGRSKAMTFAWNDRAKLWFRFANRDKIEQLVA